MSLVKALVILMLIFMCLAISLGAGPNGYRSGFKYWTDPGAFGPYNATLSGAKTVTLIEGSTGRFLGVWACLVQATFAYLGTELVGVAFGETPDPRKNVPRAVNQTLGRIVFFYIAGVLVLGMAVPYNDKLLLEALNSKVKLSGCMSSSLILCLVGKWLTLTRQLPPHSSSPPARQGSPSSTRRSTVF